MRFCAMVGDQTAAFVKCLSHSLPVSAVAWSSTSRIRKCRFWRHLPVIFLVSIGYLACIYIRSPCNTGKAMSQNMQLKYVHRHVNKI